MLRRDSGPGFHCPLPTRAGDAGAQAVPREALSGWFDQQPARLGRRDVVAAVRDLVGNASSPSDRRIPAGLHRDTLRSQDVHCAAEPDC